MEALPNFLQFGALGILVLVLYAVYHYMRLQVEEQSKMTTFVVGLIEKTMEDESKQLSEWKAMVKESISAQNKAAEEIFKNRDAIRNLTNEVVENRRETREVLEKILQAQDKNGSSSK